MTTDPQESRDYGPVTAIYNVAGDQPYFCHCAADPRPHSHKPDPQESRDAALDRVMAAAKRLVEGAILGGTIRIQEDTADLQRKVEQYGLERRVDARASILEAFDIDGAEAAHELAWKHQDVDFDERQRGAQ